MAEVGNPPGILQYGGGFVDYTDNDYNAGTYLSLTPNVATWMARDLSASAANNRMNSPFTGFGFWDNGAKLVRSRALYDTFTVSIALRVVSTKIGGVLRIEFMVNDTLKIAAKNHALTAAVGDEESLTSDDIIVTRGQFLANGAKIILTATVPVVVREFSPIFLPTGYAP